MSREAIITRDVRYELRAPLNADGDVAAVFEAAEIANKIELAQMTVVNDSGHQIVIEERKAAA